MCKELLTSNLHYFKFIELTLSYDNQYSPFKNNTSLKSLTIGDKVSSLEDYEFQGCTGITDLTIGNSVTAIGNYTFQTCTSLTEVTIPESVQSLGNNAFSGCTGLTNVEYNATSCSTPGSTSSLAFKDCSSIADVKIGDNVETIPAYLLYGCTGLTDLTIGNLVTNIESYAFYGCSSLLSVSIPNSVTNIDKFAFNGCISLIDVTIGNSVASIGANTFQGCTSLTEVTIPESVITIGDNAFSGCTGLTNVEYNATSCSTPGSTSSLAFKDCSSIADVKIGDNVETIPAYLFYGCTGLTDLTIGNSVASIGANTFQGCTSLTEVTIPESVITIGDNVFSGCTGLTKVTYNALACTSSGISNSVFNGCTSLTDFIIGNNVTTVPAYLLYGCTGITEITIPDNVTTIGTYAFTKCSGLTSINIPNGVTSIGDYAFQGCTNLYSCSFNVSQVTCQANLVMSNISGGEQGFAIGRTFYSLDSDSIASITSLIPDTKYTVSYAIKLSNGSFSIHDDNTISTTSLNLKVTATITPDSYTATGSYSERDAVVTETGYTNYTKGDNLTLTNLEPETEYTIEYYAVLASGDKCTKSITFTTPAVEFTTLPAVATSNTVALLEATTNLSNDAVGAGFEWRRYDAPDIMPSTYSECPVMEGDLMGTLNGLSSNTYYSYRPYYTSPAGNTYYGEWLAFITADAYVYFEPVVKTYAVSDVSSTSASVKGYAVQGSDNITSQGFEYWANGNSSSQNIKRVSTRVDDVTRIEVSGNWMTVTFEDLMPGTTYSYRAFVTTDVETTYGDTMTFTTDQTTGIGNIQIDATDVHEVARYTISGKRINTPQSGINIIRYSDGSVKKVYVK